MFLRVTRNKTLLNRVLDKELLLVLSCTFMIKRCLFVLLLLRGSSFPDTKSYEGYTWYNMHSCRNL